MRVIPVLAGAHGPRMLSAYEPGFIADTPLSGVIVGRFRGARPRPVVCRSGQCASSRDIAAPTLSASMRNPSWPNSDEMTTGSGPVIDPRMPAAMRS